MAFTQEVELGLIETANEEVALGVVQVNGGEAGRVRGVRRGRGHNLEVDADAPQTYYIDEATIDMLADQGAGAALVDLLRGALRGRDGVEIRWSDEA